MSRLKIYKILLLILILTAVVLTILVSIKYIRISKTENNLKQTVNRINEKKENNDEILEQMNEEIDGHKVVGIIKIPSIDIEYPILDETNATTLNLSITKFWGNEINEIGNVTLAGHNNLNGTMFGKIKKLKVGDKIELTDVQNITLEYEVYKTYIIDPNDISCIKTDQDNTRELTLITCSNGRKNRLIVKAREVQ